MVGECAKSDKKNIGQDLTHGILRTGKHLKILLVLWKPEIEMQLSELFTCPDPVFTPHCEGTSRFLWLWYLIEGSLNYFSFTEPKVLNLQWIIIFLITYLLNVQLWKHKCRNVGVKILFFDCFKLVDFCSGISEELLLFMNWQNLSFGIYMSGDKIETWFMLCKYLLLSSMSS